MKRILFVLFVMTISLPGGLSAQTTPPRQSVLLYLNMRVSDHFNMDITEDRLRRVLPMLERLKKEHPSAGVSATLLFSGAVSQALAERNTQTGIRDFVLDYAKRGIIELGYDGTNEPAKNAPLADYILAKTPKERWLARTAVAQKILTEGRDPLSGAVLANADGGLKKMQQVFGEATCIAGVQVRSTDPAVGSIPDIGGDSEVVQEVRRLNNRAIMFGLPEDVPHIDYILEDLAEAFSKAMSPVSQTPPELFWQENVLRTSERSDTYSRVLKASDGKDGLKSFLDKLDRSKTRIIHLDVGNEQNYLQPKYAGEPLYPPVQYGYAHSKEPQLPAEARLATVEVDAAFQKEEAAMEWLIKEFDEANPGSRFVSNGDLKRMTPPSTGFSVSIKSLRTTLAELETSWGDDAPPPKYIQVDGRYLSLADTFQVLADTLVLFHRTSKFPEAVEVLNVYGPVELPEDKGAPKREVTAGDVAVAAVYIVPRLHNDSWGPIPPNSIPARVVIGGGEINAAQYLRLMIGALLAGSAETKLKVKQTSMIWGPEAVAMRTRTIPEMGLIWTYKPAPVAPAPMPLPHD